MASEWWEKGYPGGPMVPLPGFPRPLYPPDAAERGKTPSVDGPDVLAYKRCCWRAGRWQGPASAFDDSFSNRFSQGAGPNVIDSGVAGVQRQQKIDATGWVGKTTFNTFRSILIPDGLPNAGEYALDATAANLLREAWEMFEGHEPTPVDSRSVRSAALRRAVGELGTVESPAGSNHTPYGSWYGVDYQPWCAIFVTWCFEFGAQDVGKDSPSFVRGSRYAYCPYIVGDARANRYGLTTVGRDAVIPGDLVVFDWQGDGVQDHVGIFEAWKPGASTFQSIEGNTSYSDNSNGGEVMRRERSTSGVVFVRVAEPGSV